MKNRCGQSDTVKDLPQSDELLELYHYISGAPPSELVDSGDLQLFKENWDLTQRTAAYLKQNPVVAVSGFRHYAANSDEAWFVHAKVEEVAGALIWLGFSRMMNMLPPGEIRAPN